MRSVMTSKERIQTTLSHQIPDRIPMALWYACKRLHLLTWIGLVKLTGRHLVLLYFQIQDIIMDQVKEPLLTGLERPGRLSLN